MYRIFITLCLVGAVRALLCYNCSSTQHSWDHCGGAFLLPSSPFNSSRYYLINCTKEHSMCFVRSWRARDRNAWIVQRGCYQMSSDDVYPKTMNTPLRSMTCKLQKLTNAEYKTCLCSADWCNSAMLFQNTFSHFKNVYILIYLVHAYDYLSVFEPVHPLPYLYQFIISLKIYCFISFVFFLLYVTLADYFASAIAKSGH